MQKMHTPPHRFATLRPRGAKSINIHSRNGKHPLVELAQDFDRQRRAIDCEFAFDFKRRRRFGERTDQMPTMLQAIDPDPDRQAGGRRGSSARSR